MRLRPILAVGICVILAIVFVSHAIRSRAAEAQHAREMALRTGLATLRAAIRTYEARHHAGPQSLQDLVTDGELRSVPADPVTGSASTWRATIEETVRTDDFSAGAPKAAAASIIDVHSGATGRDSAARRWSDY